MRFRRWLIAGGFAMVGFGLTACGDDDGDVGEAFCDDARDIADRAADISDPEELAALAGELDEAIEEIGDERGSDEVVAEVEECTLEVTEALTEASARVGGGVEAP